MNASTPCNKISKKRNPSSSPLDQNDQKKSKPSISPISPSPLDPLLTSNVDMADSNTMETVTSDTSATSSGLSEADLDKLCEKVCKMLEAKLEPMVSNAVAKALNDSELIKNLQSENSKLQARVSELETAADKAEQYSRRNCLRISGIEERPGESTDRIVIDIARALDVDLTIGEIDRSHRVGRIPAVVATDPLAPSTPPKRPIIVKFATYRARQKLYEARKLTSEETRGYKGVFVNEDLTKFRNNLLYKARCLVKAERLKGAWTSDGNIRIREHTDRVIRISKEDDLARYK